MYHGRLYNKPDALQILPYPKEGQPDPEETDIVRKTRLVWGCDVCQDVCPHNRNVQPTPIREFKTDLLYSVDVEELRKLSNVEFRKRYGNRSFSWRGRDVLIRNHETIHSG